MSVTALLAELPALPLHTAGKYVAAAYIVLFAMVLVYLGVMALRTSRIEREMGELLQRLDAERDGTGTTGSGSSSAAGPGNSGSTASGTGAHALEGRE